MSSGKSQFKSELVGRLMVAVARRSSRNQTWLDRRCRKLLERATQVPPERDFMRDEFVDADLGFDPDELERYQRGEAD